MTRPDQNHAYSSVKQFLKKFLKKFRILRWLNRQKRYYFWGRDHEKINIFSRTTFDRTPYIIRREASNVGLFSYFITIMGGIAYAHENNYIPVIDMKNYPNAYLYPNEVKHVNSWEYYFKQPTSISLEEALSSRKYILGQDTVGHKFPKMSAEAFYNYDGRLDYWRDIRRKYIRFTPAVLERLERMKAKYSGKRILGALVRGTDYVAVKPHGHPIPPTAEQAIAKCQEVMNSEGFDAVYLATEDKNILAKFQASFGEKLLLPEAEYFDYDYDNGKYLISYMNNDKYMLGLNYLVSMLFLSQCEGFITSITSGSAGVMCLSDGFKYLYVFDLGLYP